MIGGTCSTPAHQPQRAERPAHENSVHRLHGQAPAGKAVAFQTETTRTGALSVVTADGDTVNISIEGLERLRLSGVSSRNRGGQLDYTGAASESRLSLNVDVEGTLDDQEVADIAELMRQLAGIVDQARDGASSSPVELAPAQVGESLLSYGFAYSEHTETSYSASGSVVRRHPPRFLQQAA